MVGRSVAGSECLGIEIVPKAAKPTNRNLAAEGREAAQRKKPPKGTNYGGFANMAEYEEAKTAVDGGAKVNQWHARVGEENTGYFRTAIGREAKRYVEHQCVVQHRLNVLAAAEHARTVRDAATETRSGVHFAELLVEAG